MSSYIQYEYSKSPEYPELIDNKDIQIQFTAQRKIEFDKSDAPINTPSDDSQPEQMISENTPSRLEFRSPDDEDLRVAVSIYQNSPGRSSYLATPFCRTNDENCDDSDSEQHTIIVDRFENNEMLIEDQSEEAEIKQISAP